MTHKTRPSDMTTLHEAAQMALDALYSGESPPNARQQAAADAIREALAADHFRDVAKMVATGDMVMVPREPTQKMERAGNDVGLMGMSSLGSGAVYRAMIAAAPAQPVPQPEPVAWRPEVVAFATLMEKELLANDWKGGWKDVAPGLLLEHAEQEMRELVAVFLSYPRDTSEYRQALASEAADVANMVMMVADVCGALQPAAPPAAPAVRLTDEDVLNLWSPEPSRPVLGKNKVLGFARAIERAHGIGGGNE